MRKTLASLGAALAVAAGLGVATAQPANAAGDYTSVIRSWATGICVDGDYSNAYTGGCQTENGYQTWRVLNVSFSSFFLINSATGKCLAAPGGAGLGTRDCQAGDPSVQWTQTGDDNVGQYHPAANQGTCLDTNGGALYIEPCNGGGYQNWKRGY